MTTAFVGDAKVAILICADARSLTLMKAVRRERVNVVLASLADYGTSLRLNQIMGAFFDAWTLIANRYGEEPPHMWHGLITITDPWARLRASGMGKEHILVRRIPISRPTEASRWMRRILVGFKFLELVALLMIQTGWRTFKKRSTS